MYEQKFSLIAKGQDLLGDPSTLIGQLSVHKFSFTVIGEQRRVYNRIQGFPVWIEGQCDLKLCFRIEGQEWREVASYPITISYNRAEKPLDLRNGHY
jgi:hypothetical protein